MKKLFILPLFILSLMAKGQYDPSKATVTNKPLGIAQAVPTDARSYYYSPSLFIWRPYQSTAEVISTLNIAKYRIGHFPIYVSSGTLQSNGSFVGGSITEYWFKNGVADSNLVVKNEGVDNTGTVAQLRAMSTTSGKVYISTDRGGGTWVDVGPYDSDVVDDGATYIVTANNRKLKRQISGNAYPEWWGSDGTSDQTEINLAFGADKSVVSLVPNKTYYTSAPIRMTRGQILEGNGATIISTSTTNIIEGKNELISGTYQHKNAEIRDVTLKSSTAKTAINLKGFKNSIFQNIVIELTSSDTNTIGVHFQHGTSGNEQCYFNTLNNPSIYLDGPGTAIMFSGSGASGANVNFVNGGIVSGYDRYAVRIKDNSVGNKIDGLDAEHWAMTSDTAYLIESPLNTILAPHVENYATAIKVTGNANKVQGLSAAAFNTQIIDEGSGNIYEGLNSNGSGGAISIGGDLNLGSSTKIRISSETSPSIRIDSKNSNENARNWALRAGFSGNEFDFTRSNLKDGDPVAAGTAMWSINAQGHFVLPQQIKLPNISSYNTNAAAVNDGWSNGFFYTTPDGIVRNTKSGGVTGSHVEIATSTDHAVPLSQLKDSLASAGQFIKSGNDISNKNAGSVGFGTDAPMAKVDVSSLDLSTRLRVGHGSGATTGTYIEWDHSSGRGQVSTYGNFPLFFGVAGRRQFNVNDEGVTIGETLSYYGTKGPTNGLLVEGRVQAAPATQPADLIQKAQLDSAYAASLFILRNAGGTGDTLMSNPTTSTAIMKRIKFSDFIVKDTTNSDDTTIAFKVGWSKFSGTTTITGDGSATSFTIPLSVAGMSSSSRVFVENRSSGMSPVTWVDVSDESITVHYLTAPTSGSKTLNYMIIP